MMTLLHRISILAAPLALACAFNAAADVTIKVNVTDVVLLKQGAEQTYLTADATLVEGNPVDVELRVPVTDYRMECLNETSGAVIPVSQMNDYYRAFINPETSENGDVISVTVTPSDGEMTFSVWFDNPDAGFVAMLTNYDNSDSCLGEDPLESNEDEYFFPKDSGETVIPYEYNRRIRIRPCEGFALVQAWNEMETNPHAEPYKPNGRDVIEFNIFTVSIGDVVRVTTVEYGEFKVKAVGNKVEDVQMSDMATYQYVDLTDEFTPIEVTGQSYMVRCSTPSIKLEVTNGDETKEVEPYDEGRRSFIYKPSNGDELVITADDALTGVDAIGAESASAPVYNLYGVAMPDATNLPAGIYIRSGKKLIVR